MATKLVVTFSLNGEDDKDVIRWLEHQSNRSLAIREAIRDHIRRNGLTLADVYQAIKSLENKLQAGAMVTSLQEGDVWSDEPPEAAAALDALANC